MKSWLLFLVVSGLWGSSWIVMKTGLDYVSPSTFLLHRFMISVLALSPIFLLLRKKIPKDRSTLLRILVFCIISFLNVFFVVIGLAGESSGIAAVLNYTMPLFVFFMAVPLLSERVSATRVLGVAMGFMGVVVLFLNRLNSSFSWVSSFIMLMSAFFEALTYVYFKRTLSNVDPVVARFFFLCFGMIPLTALAVFNADFTFPLVPSYLMIILYSSVGALTIGWIIWLYLLQREDATVLSGSSLIIPLIALLLGWQILAEQVYLEAVFGSLLTLAGVYLTNVDNGKQKSR